ncbi:MAG: hypothetical protein FJ190_08100 [Gammaproteobacteria bacterium]|nr:hypothetical protein [Gammaproteobacteria bacterium]
MDARWQDQIAVLYEGEGEIGKYRQLADMLNVSVFLLADVLDNCKCQLYLTWQGDCLKLLDGRFSNKSGLAVEIEHRQGEQRSWPMAKTGALAQALGRKTETIVDATAGWGQDSLAMFRMGYRVSSIERHPVMAALLEDGYRRLAQQAWVRQLGLEVPKLIHGDAIMILNELIEKPDCIYLDPMFPPKRKKSALAKKAIVALRALAGDDVDKGQLFQSAMANAGKRVVVKSPDYAEPLGSKPSESFSSKLIRYDVYIK